MAEDVTDNKDTVDDVKAPVSTPTASERIEAEAKAAEEAAAAKKVADEAAADGETAEPAEPAEEETTEEVELDTSVWGDSGSDVANSVMQTLQNSGVTPDDAKALLWDAVAAGDPTKVDRDALVEKVGKANATLIMAGIQNVTDTNNAKIAEVTKTVHDAAGGKDNWNTAVAWANKTMDKGDLDELRSLIDKGGKAAKFAAADLVASYNDDPKNTALEAGKGQVTPEGKSTPKVEGISRQEYGRQLDLLHRTKATPAQFKALSLKRKAGQKQGL